MTTIKIADLRSQLFAIELKLKSFVPDENGKYNKSYYPLLNKCMNLKKRIGKLETKPKLIFNHEFLAR